MLTPLLVRRIAAAKRARERGTTSWSLAYWKRVIAHLESKIDK